MDLKVLDHYTYFIYPFVITEHKYKDFLSKFLDDSQKWAFNIHESMNDLNTYTYFLPYVKSSFSLRYIGKMNIKPSFQIYHMKKSLISFIK